jgi:hypothetical protein
MDGIFRLAAAHAAVSRWEDVSPETGFTFKHGCLRDILSTPHANAPFPLHALRWLRTLFLQAKAFHTHWECRTQQALSAIFNKGHLHNFHRHLKAAAGEVQVRYTAVLLEAQQRFRRLLRRHETCLEWLQLQLVQLQDVIA